MGIMDKVKNLFTEEVEDDRPIKKEVRHVEIPSPKIEEPKPVIEKQEEIISDNPAIKKEEKFVFPVYFDDKDFDDLEKPKKEVKKEIKKEKVKRVEKETELYNGGKEEPKEMPKNFRPSLIISPVYGVLDKNYHKEDITTKKAKQNDDIYYRKSDKVTVDDIRQKAYGTLEDELKNNVLGHEDLLKEKEENTETAIDLFSELDFDEIDKENNSKENDNTNNDLVFNNDLDDDTAILAEQLEEQKKKLSAINDYIEENTVEKKPQDEENEKEIDDFIEESQADELIEEEPIEDELEVEEEQEDEQNPDLTESELFNLIDSMYDDKEEK